MRHDLLHQVPLLLTGLRALLGPVVVVVAFTFPSAGVFAVCLCLAFLSDYFDGVIARRLGVATPGLRRLDSIADTIFYVSALLAAVHLHGEKLLHHVVPLGILLTLEVLRYVFDIKKFGREASYHMWSSKVWGLALFIGFYALLVNGNDSLAVSLAIYIGIVADIEGLAISMVLTNWRTDVPTVFHALRLRSKV